MNSKYKIGQEIKNTVAYGDVQIMDVFFSPTTNGVAYLVRMIIDDEGSRNPFYVAECELEQMFPTNH